MSDHPHLTPEVIEIAARAICGNQGYVSSDWKWFRSDATAALTAALPHSVEACAKRITMQDIRLICGEGKLAGSEVFEAVNIILKKRADAICSLAMDGIREAKAPA